MQLDRPERGFSFQKEGPLDMRMDQESQVTAQDIINQWPEKKLGELFRDYGEERRWRQMATSIVEKRKKEPFETTTQLANFIASQFGRGEKKKLHPATLIFQALRIFVNRELQGVEEALRKALQFLAPGGKIGVISFHRLEDRIVKNIFRDAASSRTEQGDKKEPLISLLTKKPLVASPEEEKYNPRARSAKLRFAVRL